MMRFKSGMAFALVLSALRAWGGDYCDSEVRVVNPGTVSAKGSVPPADAIVLFNGEDLSQWQSTSGADASWDVRDGKLSVKKGTGDIQTRRSFRDIQLHIEWRIPEGIAGEGQFRGNSGVFLQGRYEIQILDSYHNRTYADGQAGAIYGQAPPLVNAMRPPGEWNSYDVIFTAPRFYDDGTVLYPARATVLHNGVLVQNNAEILGATGAWGRPGYYEAPVSGPIRLQDHPDPSKPVSFRNIWVREINPKVPESAPTAGAQVLRIVSTRTVKQLLEDPAARAVLARCVPELVQDPDDAEYIGQRTLEALKGEADITLTDAKLQLIDEQLLQALFNRQHAGADR